MPSRVTYIGNRAFDGWTASQSINIDGHTNQESADTAWGVWWRNGCNAKIIYHS